MNAPVRVVHLTSAHPRDDARIFQKMCITLARSGYEVALVVADGLGNGHQDGVRVVDVGNGRGRLDRMVCVTWRVLRAAIELDAELYHFHDPELLPVGLALKRRGKRVIYDAHEDLGRAVLSKSYLPRWIRGVIAGASDLAERHAGRRIDKVICATPTIKEKFEKWGSVAETVANFPMLDELAEKNVGSQARSGVCYVGGLVTARGIRELVDAMSYCPPGTTLTIAGNFAESGLEDDVRAMEGWKQTIYLGRIPRDGVREVLSCSAAGLVTLHPTPAYMMAYPVKMFEYMSASLPVIASDFPLWRSIIDEAGCGLLVDPLDPEAIAEAIRRLTDDPVLAREMGERGRQAVLRHYNWHSEAGKLLQTYEQLLHV